MAATWLNLEDSPLSERSQLQGTNPGGVHLPEVSKKVSVLQDEKAPGICTMM